MATIVIPAHNEASVIGRTLTALADGTLRSGTRVVVACNGCTDDTIPIAQSFADRLQLEVIELDVASKQAALNGADAHLAGLTDDEAFPRVYLDADITAPAASVNATLDVLDAGTVLAARPPLEYQTATADPFVKAYYRARSRTPQVLEAMWGAGVYAVSAEGRRRWGQFPLDAPDDVHVDSRFGPDEKQVVDAAPVEVMVPRSSAALLKVLKRVYRPSGAATADTGQDATAQDDAAPDGVVHQQASSGSTLGALLRANSHGVREVADAAGYVGFAVAARVANRLDGRRGHSGADWERDESTR